MDYQVAEQIVREFAARSRSGLPADRWTTGVDGDRELADACRVLLLMIETQTAALSEMLAAEHERGEASMEVSADPMRAV